MRTYDHDLELSCVAIDLEREFGRDRLTTEREMRASDTPLRASPREPPRFAVPLTDGRGQLQLTPVGHPRLHFPDCAIRGSGGQDALLAVELERTAKGRSRLRRILAAYVGARHVTGVRYLTRTLAVSELVTAEIAALRAERLVDVRLRADLPEQRAAETIGDAKIPA